MTDDQTHDDSSDSNISDEKEEVSSRSKEDQDRLRTANFSILRKQLFATDSQEDRASGRRAALVDRFIKDPKLGHKTCLLCRSSFTEKRVSTDIIVPKAMPRESHRKTQEIQDSKIHHSGEYG